MNAPDKLPVGFSRSLRLREMLQSNQLEFLMEAHNGLSARIVKEAGFKAIWGSGLSISAQYRRSGQQRSELDASRGHARIHGRCERFADSP